MSIKFGHIWCIIALVALCSCSTSSNKTVTTSNIAKLKTFAFTAVDSIPGLGEATFKIEERLDTGLVTNQINMTDSLRYGTLINKVVPKFTCETTPASVVIRTSDTTITMSGKDTIDFTKTPIYMTITSSDLTAKKTYEIVVTVHQVDPDLYVWETLTEKAYQPEDEDQKTVLFGNKFWLYSNNGFENALRSSADGITWSVETLSGLPDNCRVKGIVVDDDKLYYAADQTLYTSEDAINWTADDYSDKPFTLQTMLMQYNDTMWLVVEDTTNILYLAQIVEDTVRKLDVQLDDEFPVSGFATVAFMNISGRKRAMVIGGYARNGECVNSRWNLEYSPTLQQPYRMLNYSIEQPEFAKLTGVSVISYDDKLLMFGGVDKDMIFRGNDILVSEDEGFTWHKADTAECKLPDTYTPRQKQSVIVDDDNIYIFGGQDLQETFTDVYKGRLNSIDWIK